MKVNQKNELLAFIKQNKVETPKISKEKLKRRLENTYYSIFYHTIQLYHVDVY